MEHRSSLIGERAGPFDLNRTPGGSALVKQSAVESCGVHIEHGTRRDGRGAGAAHRAAVAPAQAAGNGDVSAAIKNAASRQLIEGAAAAADSRLSKFFLP